MFFTTSTAVNHTVAGGQTISLRDGQSSGVDLGLQALNPSMSRSGTVSVGQYNVTSSQNTMIIGGNYRQIIVLGRLTINPLTITVPTLSGTSISKVYDGTPYLNGQAINTAAGSSQIKVGDLAAIAVTGSYLDKDVGTNKSVTVNFTLTGEDSRNYSLSASQVTGNYGQITQLNSVTYTGPNGGNWSTAGNWAGGALPDRSNVANIIIPVNKSVVYDDAVRGPVTSNMANSGLVDFNLTNDTSIQMDISGTGSLRISGAGKITLTGDNSYTGSTSITSGSKLVAGSDAALGSNPQIITNGGFFGTSAGVQLPSLTATGGVIKLTSDITTAGPQAYEDIVLAKSNTANTLSLASTNSDITISGTINDSVAKTSSMIINAGTGDVILGDSIGNVARFNSLTVTGRSIFILADILTGTTQTYNGMIKIGSGTYIGKQFVEGFLFSTHNQYFKYGSGAAASSYDYRNNDSRYVRTLISEDPMITFNGTVDDVAEYTHTLLVAAIAPNISSAISLPPIIKFEQPVSSILPLYSLNAQAIVSDTSVTCNVCRINLVGGVKTFGGQTYRAGVMNATATSPGGDVTFSVFDPNASVNYILPLQTNGQINLRNPGSNDGLIINGNNNFSSAANLTGDENWGTRFKEGAALGAVTARSDIHFDLRKLKVQAELTKEENLVVGEVTIDELEEESIDCARPQNDQPLDPKCRFDSNT